MLRDPDAQGKDIAYTVVTRGPNLGKAIRTQRFRYTLWHTGEELYDLDTDPHEQRNLANSSQHKETLERMRRHLSAAEKRACEKKRQNKLGR
jgi:hypothetical protein